MRRYRGYKLLYFNKAKAARMISRMITCDYTVYPLAVYERHEYLVQKRHKFLGIGFWCNVAKTTNFNFAKKAYYKLCDFKDQIY